MFKKFTSIFGNRKRKGSKPSQAPSTGTSNNENGTQQEKQQEARQIDDYYPHSRLGSPLLPSKVDPQAIIHGVTRLAIPVGKEIINAAQWKFLLNILPEAERRKVKRFYQDKDRRLALGSLLLQRAVASWVLGQDFTKILLERTEKNKPYLNCQGTRLPKWNFNVSHHGEWVIIASEPELSVGVDLVDLDDRPFEPMTALQYLEHFRRHLSPGEWDALIQLPTDDGRYKAFYRIWSVKEAYIKAIGHGLHFPIGRLECHVTDKGAHSGLDPQDELSIDGCPTEWKFSFFSLEPNYVWCTAVGMHNKATTNGGRASSSKVAANGGRGVVVDLEKMRSEYHVLTIKDCLPSELLAEYEALGRPQAVDTGVVNGVEEEDGAGGHDGP